MRKTEKKQNKKQNLMTHPTLEEKTKIKEELVASSHIENDVADKPRIQSHSSQETCPENYEPPEKKKCREKEGKTINIHKHTRYSCARSNFTKWLSWAFSIRY